MERKRDMIIQIIISFEKKLAFNSNGLTLGILGTLATLGTFDGTLKENDTLVRPRFEELRRPKSGDQMFSVVTVTMLGNFSQI